MPPARQDSRAPTPNEIPQGTQFVNTCITVHTDPLFRYINHLQKALETPKPPPPVGILFRAAAAPGKSPSSLVEHGPYTLSQLLFCCSWSICTTGVNQRSVIPHGTLVDLHVVSPTPVGITIHRHAISAVSTANICRVTTQQTRTLLHLRNTCRGGALAQSWTPAPTPPTTLAGSA